MDHTRTITALQRRKIEMMSEKKLAEIEVKEKYAARIREEVSGRIEDSERDFALALREAVEEGVPQSLLRSEVLRTNDWKQWVKWRDLAQIEPERIKTQNARETAKIRERGYEWNDDYSMLTILRIAGRDLPAPLNIIDWGTNPPDFSEPEDVMWAYKRLGFDIRDVTSVGRDAIKSALEEGRILPRKSNYDMYRDKEISAEELMELREKEKEVNSEWLQFIE